MFRVYVFPLRYPGLKITGLPDAVASEVLTLLRCCEGHLADAAIGLSYFEAAQRDAVDKIVRRDNPQAYWFADQARRRPLEEQCRRLHPEPPFESPEQWTRWRNEVDDCVHLRLLDADTDRGVAPHGYIRRLPFLYAHTVLFVCDGIDKTLGVLARRPDLPPGVKDAHGYLTGALPGLRSVRDSSHHMEDRVRRLGKYEKPLDLKPVTHSMIGTGPAGSVFGLDSLEGDHLCTTGTDGAYHRFPITAGTVKVAQQAVQRSLDSLNWEGHSTVTPEPSGPMDEP